MQFTPTAALAIQATLPRSNLVTSAYTPPNGYFPVSPWAGGTTLLCRAADAPRHCPDPGGSPVDRPGFS
jgi:hypothetical protein